MPQLTLPDPAGLDTMSLVHESTELYRTCERRRARPTAPRSLPESQLRRLLERPDDLLRGNLARPVKISHDSVIVEADLTSAEGPCAWPISSIAPETGGRPSADCFGRSRALRAWHLARALQARGIPTAQPIAACQPNGVATAGHELPGDPVDRRGRRICTFTAGGWRAGRSRTAPRGGRCAREPRPPHRPHARRRHRSPRPEGGQPAGGRSTTTT